MTEKLPLSSFEEPSMTWSTNDSIVDSTYRKTLQVVLDKSDARIILDILGLALEQSAANGEEVYARNSQTAILQERLRNSVAESIDDQVGLELNRLEVETILAARHYYRQFFLKRDEEVSRAFALLPLNMTRAIIDDLAGGGNEGVVG